MAVGPCGYDCRVQDLKNKSELHVSDYLVDNAVWQVRPLNSVCESVGVLPNFNWAQVGIHAQLLLSSFPMPAHGHDVCCDRACKRARPSFLSVGRSWL